MVQQETLPYRDALRLFEPMIRPVLGRQLQARLEDIKEVLESGWTVNP